MSLRKVKVKSSPFFFEAFDEPRKGFQDPNESEKHWGLFYEDRTPKLVLAEEANYQGKI